MRTPIAAALAGILLFAQALASAPTPEERFDAALKVLKAKCGEFCGFGDDPAETKAFDALWDTTQDWTVAFLNAHPGITAERLKTELLNRHPMNIDAESIAPGWATLLARDLYAFSAYWGETGDTFLVDKRDGRWTVVWDVRKADAGKFPVLAAWRAGRLWGSAFPIKPDAQGRVRFGLGGTYAQVIGTTFSRQISFWRWDGTTAEPLLAHTYQQTIEDQQASVPDTPRRVVVRAKDEYKTVSACGSCVGRQLDWTFRILPDRIVDEGKRSLDPEADFIDDLYARLKDHLPVAGSGAPQALALMAEQIPDGMGQIASQRDRTGVRVCLSADSADQPASADSYASLFLRFHIVRRGTGFFIDKAERLSQGDSEKLCYPTAQ